jgi:hypothetical protein
MDEKYNEFLGGNPNAPQITTPISFPEHLSNSPFRKFGVNEDKRFAINRFTNNGAYVRGGMLYFRLNGVDIFTETTNSIFVDKSNNSVIIRPANNLQNIEEENVDPEQRQYVILMYSKDGDDTYYRWESMIGRKTMYEYIVNNVEDFDPDNSIILTDNVAMKDALTVVQFVKYLQNANLVEEDDFDIDQYIGEF